MPSHRWPFVWIAAASLFAMTACAPAAEQKNKDETTAKPTTPQDPEPTVGGPNEIVKKFDTNQDKRPDMWRIYVQKTNSAGKTDLELVRVEMDLNYDNKVDIQRFYKDNTIIREKFDLDFDGKFDVENTYHQGFLYKQAYYIRSKERPDVFKYYEVVGEKKKRTVQLVRKERDTNLDGKIDYWEYWENGRLDRIGRDTDFDGKVDVWEKGDTSN